MYVCACMYVCALAANTMPLTCKWVVGRVPYCRDAALKKVKEEHVNRCYVSTLHAHTSTVARQIFEKQLCQNLEK